MAVRFLRYALWPDSRFQNDESPIVLGIIGDRDAYTGACKAGKTKVEKRPVQVVMLPALDGKEETRAKWSRCHAIYVADSSKPEEVIAFSEKRQILTVSDLSGFSDKGGVIELVLVVDALQRPQRQRVELGPGRGQSGADLVEPGRRLGEPGVYPVERRQLREHAGFGQRQCPGDDRETPDAGRHRDGRRGGVLAAHRPAHDGKPLHPKVIHQLADVGGPVQDRASGTGVRSSDARAVGGDHPDTRRAGRPVGRSDVESASQTTVGVDDDGAIGCAVVGVGHYAPVAQPHRAVFAITGHGIRLP